MLECRKVEALHLPERRFCIEWIPGLDIESWVTPWLVGKRVRGVRQRFVLSHILLSQVADTVLLKQLIHLS